MSIKDLTMSEGLSQWINKILLAVVSFFLVQIYFTLDEAVNKIDALRMDQVGIKRDIQRNAMEINSLKEYSYKKFTEYDNGVREFFQIYDLKKK